MILYLLQLSFLFLTVIYLINNKDNIVDNINNIIHQREYFSEIESGISIGLIFYSLIIALVFYLLLPKGKTNKSKDLSPSAAFMLSTAKKLEKTNIQKSLGINFA